VAQEDDGASYKRAEIGITSRVDDPHFFSPGYSSPFNPHDATFTLYLIKLFGAAVPLLELKNADVLIDSGCGYAWTTEWLYKAGVEAIGVDICRTYLEIGIQRMGVNRPHLIVADVEHLPIRSGSADAVFGYESFHHVPDRQKAMAGFGRALKPGGRLVLAEPGAAHEDAQVSVDVMNKYGILEKGMELEDVQQYVAGTPLRTPEQLFLLRASQQELGKTLDRVFVRTHSVVEGNLFRIVRSETILETVTTAWRNPRRVVWPRVKRRVKAALVMLGLE
jgi:SAM-dependent methyltransferase